MPNMFEDHLDILPQDFELEVQRMLAATDLTIRDFKASHLELIEGADGSYKIDVSVRFELLGAQFLVLVECKRHKKAVEREDVQVLYSKMQSLGAQKGMFFSTSPFQSGAVKFAQEHHIALVFVTHSKYNYITKRLGGTLDTREGPPAIGWLVSLDEAGEIYSSLADRIYLIRDFLTAREALDSGSV